MIESSTFWKVIKLVKLGYIYPDCAAMLLGTNISNIKRYAEYQNEKKVIVGFQRYNNAGHRRRLYV